MEKKDIKILIVEDDTMLNKIYQTKLGILGYQVAAAFDGEEGLKKMESEVPHLVMLDLMLPKKSGFEVLEGAKGNLKTARIPVIILSNLGQESDMKHAMELGAADFLVKSNIKLEAVIQKVEGVLRKFYP
ncbi:response regulator [Candidatus Azambacteria bacterium]|nr:response regulator [Candidatus Azambacteria bacterium]MBI3684987.1 response regulator [Candidatus Azambacteria bacterium]